MTIHARLTIHTRLTIAASTLGATIHAALTQNAHITSTSTIWIHLTIHTRLPHTIRVTTTRRIQHLLRRSHTRRITIAESRSVPGKKLTQLSRNLRKKFHNSIQGRSATILHILDGRILGIIKPIRLLIQLVLGSLHQLCFRSLHIGGGHAVLLGILLQLHQPLLVLIVNGVHVALSITDVVRTVTHAESNIPVPLCLIQEFLLGFAHGFCGGVTRCALEVVLGDGAVFVEGVR